MNFARCKKILISGFILIHGFLIIGASLPDPNLGLAKAVGFFLPYQDFTSFYQGWSMFAPHPGGTNSYVDATVDFTDGSHVTWTFPRPVFMGFLEKSLIGEKYRKMGQEKLLPFQNFELWNDVSRYAIQDLSQVYPGKEIANLQFYRHSNTVQVPEQAFISHGTISNDNAYDTESTFQYKLPVRFGYEAKNSR